MKITEKTVKEMAKSIGSIVLEVCKAKAHAEIERENMNAVDLALLLDFELFDENGERILNPKHTWLAENEETYLAYSEARKNWVAENYPQLDREFCPALVAESALVDAENALLAAASAWVPEFSKAYTLKLRKQALELLMGMGAPAAKEQWVKEAKKGGAK